MPLSTIKPRVRESFERAATTYDAAAVVQRRVCERLLETLDPSVFPLAHQLLDAGCGTGYGVRLLRQRWPTAHITGVDFAPAMLDLARHDSDACCAADIEMLPFAAASFDLWWSSLTIQWCDTDIAFAEAARVLRPGGQLALSTLGPGTFKELRAAFSTVDQHRHTLPFSAPKAISEALTHAGFCNISLRREKHTAHYPNLKTLLHAVKAIGAHNVGEGGRSGMMGRQAWQQVEAAYEQHREAAGLPASYDVIIGYARK
ncbi:malonyl-ACP O-methyltransferase BioC [Propionivibrio sp.]|uniref:malonyl-ACP O-methyltransferase BioC n=1 Tax=Propionivibrio sp. TaxID=2212460 RepID=UPI0026092C52|nr:malonyl-ACP O-methyltransferase BioC [Propionivibrio sp.]